MRREASELVETTEMAPGIAKPVTAGGVEGGGPLGGAGGGGEAGDGVLGEGEAAADTTRGGETG